MNENITKIRSIREFIDEITGSEANLVLVDDRVSGSNNSVSSAALNIDPLDELRSVSSDMGVDLHIYPNPNLSSILKDSNQVIVVTIEKLESEVYEIINFIKDRVNKGRKTVLWLEETFPEYAKQELTESIARAFHFLKISLVGSRQYPSEWIIGKNNLPDNCQSINVNALHGEPETMSNESKEPFIGSTNYEKESLELLRAIASKPTPTPTPTLGYKQQIGIATGIVAATVAGVISTITYFENRVDDRVGKNTETVTGAYTNKDTALQGQINNLGTKVDGVEKRLIVEMHGIEKALVTKGDSLAETVDSLAETIATNTVDADNKYKELKADTDSKHKELIVKLDNIESK